MNAPDADQVLCKLPEAGALLLREVLERADAKKLEVFLVGGPVRDWFLGRSLRDIDLVIESGGLSAADLARGAESDDTQIVVHERFGTVTLTRGEFTLDIATVRRETYAFDGALPSVEMGTLADDLQRRDFAANALAIPLSNAARARSKSIIDPEGGLADIAERRLRVLHPRSFHDDPTRALRAARLAPRLGFTLSRGSRSSLRDSLRDGAFGRVSGDRLRREIVKLFDEATVGLDPARALRLLDDWHVLGALEPGLTLEAESAVPLRRLGRAVAAPPWRPIRWRPWVSGLALWLAQSRPDLRRRVLRRFSVRGQTAKRIQTFGRDREGWLRALGRARGRGAIDRLLRERDEEELHALYSSADPALRRRIARYAGEDRSRRAPVTGDDLMEVGLAGPEIGRALARIRAAYLDGLVRDRAGALALAQELSQRGARARQSPKRAGK